MTSPVRTSSTRRSQNGLEGVVAKRRASPYRPGRRSPDWTKVKSFRTQEVVVGAWTDGRGERRDSLGALLLGIPDDGGLRYVGKVGTGLQRRAHAPNCSTTSSPWPRRTTRSSPRSRPPMRGRPTSCVPSWWARSSSASGRRPGRLRQPTWRGLRPDKAPDEVVVE